MRLSPYLPAKTKQPPAMPAVYSIVIGVSAYYALLVALIADKIDAKTIGWQHNTYDSYFMVGKGNSYGHPDDNPLSRLRDADVDVYRTDLQGDIVITTDGTDLSIRTEKSASREELLTAGQIVQTKPTSAPGGSGTGSSAGGTDYVANKNTGKFHYPDCSSVKQMKESNKLYFNGTRDELISKGYDPCKKCNP